MIKVINFRLHNKVMNTKKLLDGTAEKVEKIVLVGWRPMIRCGKYVPGIYQNFEVILGGIRQDTGEEMVCLSYILNWLLIFSLDE